MGPFFCEFTLNGDLLPSQYPATYTHEIAPLLGITSEAEANFYAYQVCTRSQVESIRFSGYFSVLSHILGLSLIHIFSQIAQLHVDTVHQTYHTRYQRHSNKLYAYLSNDTPL